MDTEKEVRELKQRVAELEGNSKRRSKGPRLLTWAGIAILAVFVLLIVVGVVQFISAGDSP